jgi:hypothetical protein
MTSQTSGAAPGSSATWRVHVGAAAADPSCATRLSLVRGATGAAPCKAPEGGGVGGPRADRGLPAPAAGVVAPHPLLPEPRAPRDFPVPPLRSVELGGDGSAIRSAGRAAPDAADRGRSSSGRGAVKALAANAPRPRPAAALRVTAPRQGRVERDGGEGADARSPAFAAVTELQSTYLRPAPRASAGIHRGVPVPGGRSSARPYATHATTPAREAGGKEEDS